MIRRARADDTAAIADVFVAARAGMIYLPPQPSDDGFRSFIGPEIMRREEVWVAEAGGEVVGFVTLAGQLLDHMYVHPREQGRGVGTALLGRAKSRRPTRLELWVFQRNEGARRFYERHDFRLVRLTDGLDNMEREPDALYEWRPAR
jgi:GNAT superfamily N-acetyltransferase